MLTAHLPAGYSLTRLLRQTRASVVVVALVFSILPDLDLLWFYLVDNRSIHHHRYWVHVPFFWALIFLPAIAVSWRSRFRPHVLVAAAAIYLHLFLDTIVGGIMWLAPFSEVLFRFVTVPPAEHYHWLLTFMLHWTFLLEIAVWALAIGLFVGQLRNRAAGQDVYESVRSES